MTLVRAHALLSIQKISLVVLVLKSKAVRGYRYCSKHTHGLSLTEGCVSITPLSACVMLCANMHNIMRKPWLLFSFFYFCFVVQSGVLIKSFLLSLIHLMFSPVSDAGWLSILLKLYSSLPSFDKDTKEQVDKNIKSVRKWIKEYLWHLQQSWNTFFFYNY